MSDYRPSSPFVTPIMLIIPEYATVKGVRRKAYPESGPVIWCSFKTYGGTERNEGPGRGELRATVLYGGLKRECGVSRPAKPPRSLFG